MKAEDFIEFKKIKDGIEKEISSLELERKFLLEKIEKILIILEVNNIEEAQEKINNLKTEFDSLYETIKEKVKEIKLLDKNE